MVVNAKSLKLLYDLTKKSATTLSTSVHVDPRAVFCNNTVELNRIAVYGFDYDYTIAVYTRAINKLIYDLSVQRLVKHFKYPRDLLSVPYDPTFAIRGLHFDTATSCLLKVDAFSQIQDGTVFRGRRRLSRSEVSKQYGRFSLSDRKVRSLLQLIDLFSLPWAGLLAITVQYFDENNIAFDQESLFHDVKSSVQSVHASGEMHHCVMAKIDKYVHKNDGLEEYLSRLIANGKTLFLMSNSPFPFVNCGMQYMLGNDWRKYFKHIIVMARKPEFFHNRTPFRIYHENDDSLSFEKVYSLEPGTIYAKGNIVDLCAQPTFSGSRVLYFGDHLYTDLADPILNLGWHTAAIVPELAREIRTQNEESYRKMINWLEMLTSMIERYQHFSNLEEVKDIIQQWFDEREYLREEVKKIHNPQFGSMFRTYHNMSFFSRRLSRLADIYTSRLPNMLKYSDDYTFFPRRNALPHELPIPQIPQLCDTLISAQVNDSS
ncbi:hypothetical protein AB6A40_003545 [Gnathostoma spinigerum]|uniref:5'-nucleotidase domain-containing protein 3 n=1 Tax=Gnathostoma spinigerum TaxID=75299 RepID=A0ABD6EB18_9BILA